MTFHDGSTSCLHPAELCVNTRYLVFMSKIPWISQKINQNGMRKPKFNVSTFKIMKLLHRSTINWFTLSARISVRYSSPPDSYCRSLNGSDIWWSQKPISVSLFRDKFNSTLCPGGKLSPLTKEWQQNMELTTYTLMVFHSNNGINSFTQTQTCATPICCL